MTTCPDEGVLRTLLDHGDADADAAVPDATAVRAHLDGCARCRDVRDRLRSDAAFAATAIGGLAASEAPSPFAEPGPEDAGPALRRARRRQRAVGRTATAHARARRRVAAAIAATALVVVGAGTETGRAAATSVLSVFRAERIEVVTFDPAEMEGDLAALGELGEVTGEPPERVEVADLDAAADVAGFAPATPEAPPAPGPATIAASAPSSLSVAFSSATTPDLPPELDGAVLHVDIPGGVVQRWGGTSGAAPGTVIGEATAPEVRLEGAALEDLRAWLLEQPGLSPDLVDQLQAMTDWRTTLPLPVPSDGVVWEDVTVGGVDGVAFGDESGTGAAVVWQEDGRIHAVGGTLPQDEAMAIAGSLAGR